MWRRKLMAITEEHTYFLNRLMDRYNIEYPARYKVGVEKYKSTIHIDYTIPEHIKNLREELYDALAYLEAIDILFEHIMNENEQLKARVKELEDELRKHA